MYEDDGESHDYDDMGVYNDATSPNMSYFPRSIPDVPRALEPRIKRESESGELRNDTAQAMLAEARINQPEHALRLLVDATHQIETKAAEHVSTMPLDPALTNAMQTERPVQDPQRSHALQTWGRLRFVRAGWFTAQEGLAYFVYFDEHLSPLTPIAVGDLKNMANQIKLLEEEPMLTITLLAITSRYKKLLGPGGASRSIHIHQRLWLYLQDMITKMFWGQEQFGGGFCGAGATKTGEELAARRRGLRSLGTVER